jgi:hypothetical protein
MVGTLGALALFAVVLLFADFHLATSNTGTQASTSSARSNPTGSDGAPVAGSAGSVPMLWLYVEGEDTASATMRERLKALLDKGPQFGSVTLLAEPPSAAQYPALVAGISEQEVLWTPFYGEARLHVRFSYASDKGALSWRDDEPWAFESGAPATRARGDLAVGDRTWGLVTRPGYQGLLGRACAEAVGKELGRVLERQH